LFPVAFKTALAATDVPAGSLSEADETCLSCHSLEGMEKDLANGETLSLHVRGEDFAKSVHVWIGCAGCHTDVDLEDHPAERNIDSARGHSIVRAEVCRQCHADKYEQYRESIHAVLLDGGDLAAPVCTDCHGSHSVGPKAAYETIAGVPCKKCHESIFNAYLGSMHGEARGEMGHIEAPICADCHRAHDVGVASTGTRLRDACLACHEGATDSHQAWLPNTGLHFEAVSCPACHAPTARRRIDLGLYDAVAQRPVSEQEGLPRLDGRIRSADADGDGLDAMELWNLVRDINREGTAAEMTLRGRMEVHTGVEAHQLAGKTEAIRSCDSCHRESAEPFQSVTISIVRPDGRPVHYGADKEVLSSPVSVGSLGGFYVIGGTRIKLLDILLLLAVLGGVSVPIGHMAMRKFLRKSR
jgi:hypothetical protein